MATKDKITSVRQPVPSTNVLEERLDRSEKNLRDSLSKVPSALDSTEEFLIKGAIKSIKLTSQIFVTDSLALSDRKTHTGHMQEGEELNRDRISLNNRDSYDAVKLLKKRLEEIGGETCSSLKVFNETVPDSDLEVTVGTATDDAEAIIHNSKANLGAESKETVGNMETPMIPPTPPGDGSTWGISYPSADVRTPDSAPKIRQRTVGFDSSSEEDTPSTTTRHGSVMN